MIRVVSGDFRQQVKDNHIEHPQRIISHGKDMPEMQNWKLNGNTA